MLGRSGRCARLQARKRRRCLTVLSLCAVLAKYVLHVVITRTLLRLHVDFLRDPES